MRLKASLGLLLAMALLQLPSAGASTGTISLDAGVAAALKHVRENAASFDVSAADVADLKVTNAHQSAQTGATFVYLRQRLSRLEVLEGTMTVGVLRDGTVFSTQSRLIADLASKASGSVVLSPVQAFASAVRELGAVAPRESAAPKIAYQTSEGALRLAWNLEIDAGDHWWNTAVDAETGKVLAAYDYVVHEEFTPAPHSADTAARNTPLEAPSFAGMGSDGASYRVIELPLDSPNDGPRTLVTNPAHPIASPHGWHDTNGVAGPEYTLTNGNNVNAAWDPTGPANAGGLIDETHAEGGPSLTFDFEADTTLPPTTFKDAAVTNLFYWNNIIHDVFYGYGFDERAGNFQEKNYERDGFTWPFGDGDRVQADAQDGGGVNNANFATPGDGSSPRMQMFIWQNGRQLRDGDLDSGIIIHEYGHGISNRLTGGASNSSCLRNAEQGGEGWSDFLSLATTVLPGEAGSLRRGLATYSAGGTSRYDAGIRPTQYRSTSLTPTYNSIKSAAVPHGVGWVWASMLWDVFWKLADAGDVSAEIKGGLNPNVYGDWKSGGNNRAIQLIMDGMKLQACSPGFVDSRNGILAADVALTGGADRCRLWQAFARRGLGLSASQGSSASSTDGTQAFDVPADC